MFISFQENYQTAEIYFYSYYRYLIPLNKTIYIILSTSFFQFNSLTVTIST